MTWVFLFVLVIVYVITSFKVDLNNVRYYIFISLRRYSNTNQHFNLSLFLFINKEINQKVS